MDQEGALNDLVAELTALGYAVKPPPALGTQQAFDWVADCLLWLCQRMAPDINLARDCSTEAKRVTFMTSLASQLFTKTRIKLPLRRLYRAGSGAVQELRLLAGRLHEAAAALEPAPTEQQPPPVLSEQERGELRELSQRITSSSAQLVAALTAAPSAAAVAAEALAATTDVGAVERELQAGLAAAKQQTGKLEQAVAALGQDVQVMEARVEKRHVELDRLERRLDSLQTIKPAFSAEAEALESELSGLFQQYLHRFRNLEWLEGALDAHAASRQAEAEEADRQLRRIQRQVAADELRLLQGDSSASPAASAELAGGLDSEDSEAATFAGWAGPKALPRLGGGMAGNGSPGGVAGAKAGMSGKGGSPGAKTAVAVDLHLLPEEDSSGSGRGGTPGSKGGASRLGTAGSGGLDGAAAGGTQEGGSSKGVTFGGASLIPAHRGPAGGNTSSASGGGLRPGSASARRATGSANAMVRKGSSGLDGGAEGGATGGADVLVLGGSPASHIKRSSPGDNDF